MSVRVLLAVVLAAALLASSLPAIQDAQRARADHQLRGSADRLGAAIEDVSRHNDPVPLDVPGARRRVQVEVPTNAERAVLQIHATPRGNRSGAPARIDVSVPGNPTRHTMTAAPLGIWRDGRVVRDGPPLTLREDTVLTLGYRRVNGTPTVTVARGFKSGNRTTSGHVRTAE